MNSDFAFVYMSRILSLSEEAGPTSVDRIVLASSDCRNVAPVRLNCVPSQRISHVRLTAIIRRAYSSFHLSQVLIPALHLLFSHLLNDAAHGAFNFSSSREPLLATRKVIDLLVHRSKSGIHSTHLLRHYRKLLVEANLDVVQARVHGLLELGDRALPARLLVLSQRLRLDGENEPAQVASLDGLATHHNHEVGQDADLFTERRLFLDFGDASEGVSHDSDEHIEEGDLRNEGRADEDDPRQYILALLTVVVRVKFSQTQHVLIHDHVEEVDSEVIAVDLFSSTLAQNEQDVAKGEEDEDEEDHEVADVDHGLPDESDIERGTLEQTHPVEGFEPDQDAAESCQTTNRRSGFIGGSTTLCLD